MVAVRYLRRLCVLYGVFVCGVDDNHFRLAFHFGLCGCFGFVGGFCRRLGCGRRRDFRHRHRGRYFGSNRGYGSRRGRYGCGDGAMAGFGFFVLAILAVEVVECGRRHEAGMLGCDFGSFFGGGSGGRFIGIAVVGLVGFFSGSIVVEYVEFGLCHSFCSRFVMELGLMLAECLRHGVPKDCERLEEYRHKYAEKCHRGAICSESAGVLQQKVVHKVAVRATEVEYVGTVVREQPDYDGDRAG